MKYIGKLWLKKPLPMIEITEKLIKCGLKDMSDEFSQEALQSDSYEDVIELALKYVKIDEIPNR